jgi:hypothetical protein
MSSIDQALSDHSLVALSRVAYTPPDAFPVSITGDRFCRDPETGLMLDVALHNKIQARILPQIHVTLPDENDNRETHVIAPDMESHRRLDAFIRAAVKEGTLGSTHIKVGPDIAGPTIRFVLHRKDQAYVRVPLGNRDEGVLLLKVIEKAWEKFGSTSHLNEDLPSRPIEQPTVTSRMSICPDDIHRAVAKIAFNLMAVRLGTHFALRLEFDPIRKYIIGEDVSHDVPREGEVSMDTRFVQQRHGGETFVATENHTVLLATQGKTLFALVTLYGEHEYRVLLGDVDEVPGQFIYCLTEYSKTRDGYRVLGLDETYERVVERRLGKTESTNEDSDTHRSHI